jgi:DNA-binding IscR family transcriptional regulator
MVATRFAVAAHILVLLAGSDLGRDHQPPLQPATSARLARIVNTNPVVVRRITGKLARAGLIRVHRGPGGAELSRPAREITLDDVWRAVHAGGPRPLVPLHPRPPIENAPKVHDVMAEVFGDAEAAFRQALRQVTLAALAEQCTREIA